MKPLVYNYNSDVAQALSDVTGFPPNWYGGDPHYLMPPMPPPKYWLVGASPRLLELQVKWDLAEAGQGDPLVGEDFLDYYRLRGLNDFYFFAKRIAGLGWLRSYLHGSLAWAWSAPNGTRTPWGQVWGRDRKAVVARGHLKTTLLTQMFAVWLSLRNSEERILIYTQSDEFAEQLLAPVKDLFEGVGENGPFFVQLYHKHIPLEADRGKKYKWDQHNLTLLRRGRYTDPTIKAKGFGGRVAGTHSTWHLIDDMVAEELSRTMMDKRIRVYNSLIYLYHSLALGQRRLVGTPWGFHDIISHSLKYRPDTLVARIPWSKKPDAEEGLTDEDLVFPPIEPVDDHGGCDVKSALEEKAKSRWFFNCQYNVNAKDDEKAGFQRQWFKYYRLNREKIIILDRNGEPSGDVVDLRTCNVFIIVDPNTGRKPGENFGTELNIARANKVDHVGMIVLAIDDKNYWYVLYALRWRLSTFELIDKVFELVGVWQPQSVAIETTSAQLILIPHFIREWERGRPQFNLRDWGPNQGGLNKIEERIKGLQPLYRNGFVYHREHENWEGQQGIDALEGELLDYPTAEYDDLSDALSAALKLVYKPGSQLAATLQEHKTASAEREALAKLDRGSRKMARWIAQQTTKRKDDEFWVESHG